MRKYEMLWKPNISGFLIQTSIIEANSLQEATKIIEGQAKMMGATSINWLGKREIR